jgi:hypothetical protein
MKTLTQRQLDALTVYHAGGKIDRGMMAALIRKGAIQDGAVQTPVKSAARSPEPSERMTDISGVPSIDYTRRTWGSLSDLVERIERDGVEEVQEFNGYQVVTNKHVYGLAFGELTVTAVGEAQ